MDNVHPDSPRNNTGDQYAENQTGVIHILLLSGVGPFLFYGYIIVSKSETRNTKNGTETPQIKIYYSIMLLNVSNRVTIQPKERAYEQDTSVKA